MSHWPTVQSWNWAAVRGLVVWVLRPNEAVEHRNKKRAFDSCCKMYWCICPNMYTHWNISSMSVVKSLILSRFLAVSSSLFFCHHRVKGIVIATAYKKKLKQVWILPFVLVEILKSSIPELSKYTNRNDLIGRPTFTQILYQQIIAQRWKTTRGINTNEEVLRCRLFAKEKNFYFSQYQFSVKAAKKKKICRATSVVLLFSSADHHIWLFWIVHTPRGKRESKAS